MFLIKKNHHTEKSLHLNEKGKYTFIVDVNATKNEIKKAISTLYKVKIVDVNTCMCAGKKVRRYTRKKVTEGKRADYKKAIVTLQEGDMLDVYAGNI